MLVGMKNDMTNLEKFIVSKAKYVLFYDSVIPLISIHSREMSTCVQSEDIQNSVFRTA